MTVTPYPSHFRASFVCSVEHLDLYFIVTWCTDRSGLLVAIFPRERMVSYFQEWNAWNLGGGGGGCGGAGWVVYHLYSGFLELGNDWLLCSGRASGWLGMWSTPMIVTLVTNNTEDKRKPKRKNQMQSNGNHWCVHGAWEVSLPWTWT